MPLPGTVCLWVGLYGGRLCMTVDAGKLRGRGIASVAATYDVTAVTCARCAAAHDSLVGRVRTVRLFQSLFNGTVALRRTAWRRGTKLTRVFAFDARSLLGVLRSQA